MEKNTHENLAILLDLNTIGMLKLLKAGGRDPRTGAAFGVEDVVELAVYALNAAVLQNSANGVSLFVFDECDADLVFPVGEADAQLAETLDFGQIRRAVLDRVLAHLRAKTPADRYHSRFVSALYKAVCCELTRLQLLGRPGAAARDPVARAGGAQLGRARGRLLQPDELRAGGQGPGELTRTS